ncbi:glycosyltransferase family 9 protein [Cytophagaceae bacterium DM2B3-1]|uniref:Glycosyltransferase family 9 protein n=1 Tax=Xanthocytophaga flava TaxID=3048013 RepID=A0ABT7CJW1_9BACT|nr:glycosyltransferase family 9 protein [Xanthocytophaga flavus]MDJ1493992.1 glycosyltransferase family 9 protein [Xanthocytophaga flavus]
MKPDSMRTIDRWAGVPLTFLFSIVLFFTTIFRKRSAKPNLHHTLFIELSEMGSAIIADPAMRKLKAEGNAELYFAIFKSNKKSLDLLKTIPSENIFGMRSENIWVLAVDVIKFIFWCRSKKINTVIDLELFSRFTALLTALSGASTRIGFGSIHDEGLYRGKIITHPVRYNAHVHISVNFISLINTALGFHNTPYPTHPIDFQSIKLEKAIIDSKDQQEVLQKIKNLYPQLGQQKIFLLNVNASDLLPQRKWLPERFAEIGRNFLENNPDWIILATGAPNEYEYVKNVVDMINDSRCINTAGAFKFEELVPLYSISSLMLTNDSGPAHFASVTNLKTFVIFGPETPNLYLPLGGNAEPIYLGLPCSPCVSAANHRKTTCITRPCITGISTAMVQQKIDSFVQSTFPVYIKAT